MAQQTINTGTIDNDGTGDTLKASMIKVNDNFDELYGTVLGKSATYTILTTDTIIECTANSFTLTLPTAVGVNGKRYIIKNSGTGTITIDGDGTETIDGSLTVVLSSQYDSLTIISNGSDWSII